MVKSCCAIGMVSLVLAGCDAGQAPPAPASELSAPAGSAVPARPGVVPAGVPSAAPPRLRLSTGVALAQTLPQGTTVLCSMDYQWTDGGPQPDTQYIWVVELGSGKRLTGPADVAKPRGMIKIVLDTVRPEDGPFKGAIVAKHSAPGVPEEPVSDFIELKD